MDRSGYARNGQTVSCLGASKVSLFLTQVHSTNWPMITIKHDELAQAFLNRMHRDQCSPVLTWNYSDDGNSVVSVTVGTNLGNKCNTAIPVTVPANIKALPMGATKEQVGSDPLTVWVTLNGQPQTIPLNPPLALV